MMLVNVSKNRARVRRRISARDWQTWERSDGRVPIFAKIARAPRAPKWRAVSAEVVLTVRAAAHYEGGARSRRGVRGSALTRDVAGLRRV